MTAELIVLRLIHILGGIFWVGGVAYNAFFMLPALGIAGPAAAGAVMAGLTQRRLFTVMPAAAIITMLAGLRLMQLNSDGFGAPYFRTGAGHTYLVGSVLALAAFLLGMLVARPAMLKAGALMAGREKATPDARATIDAQVATLRRRGTVASLATTVGLIAAAAAMAVARYV